MVVCIAHSEAVVRLMLGERWLDASPFFAWIAIGGLTSGLFASLAWLFISQDRTSEYLRLTIATSVIGLGSNFVGAIWGATGIAAAGALTFVAIVTPMGLHRAMATGPVRLSHLGPIARNYCIATCAAAAMVWAFSILSIPGSWTPVAAAVGVALLPYAILVLLVRAERNTLLSILRSLRATKESGSVAKSKRGG